MLQIGLLKQQLRLPETRTKFTDQNSTIEKFITQEISKDDEIMWVLLTVISINLQINNQFYKVREIMVSFFHSVSNLCKYLTQTITWHFQALLQVLELFYETKLEPVYIRGSPASKSIINQPYSYIVMYCIAVDQRLK